MSKIVLVTGGTGLVGTRLTSLLIEKGYQVRYLSRNPGKVSEVESFSWDIDRQTIDEKALDGVDYIIHLAGAGVADKKWTTHKVYRSLTISPLKQRSPGKSLHFCLRSRILWLGYRWRMEEGRQPFWRRLFSHRDQIVGSRGGPGGETGDTRSYASHWHSFKR